MRIKSSSPAMPCAPAPSSRLAGITHFATESSYAPVLQEYARAHGVKPGWLFFTGRGEDIEKLRRKLGFVDLSARITGTPWAHLPARVMLVTQVRALARQMGLGGCGLHVEWKCGLSPLRRSGIVAARDAPASAAGTRIFNLPLGLGYEGLRPA